LPLLARTLAFNVYLNFAKEVFANPGALDAELPSICSSVKAMCGWNYVKTASVARERCGGMGFLSHSRFAEYLACAHTAITAEGDNRVLMHKVVKDTVKSVMKGQKLPQPRMNVTKQIGTFDDVSSMDALIDLFRFKLIKRTEQLLGKTKELKGLKVESYDINMYHTSELI
jgi:acyl-CoA oxidase